MVTERALIARVEAAGLQSDHKTLPILQHLMCNPPYPPFDKGGDGNAPFRKGAARARGDFDQALYQSHVFRFRWTRKRKY
jgi:hypothetical protein